jgi:single-strand DNA-binding protein
MSGKLTCILVGQLMKEPDMSYTPNGMACTKIVLLEEVYAGPGKEKEKVWWNVTLWDKTAEVVSEWCTKGTVVHINGRIRLRQWDQGGKHGAALEFKVSKLDIIYGMKSKNSTPVVDNLIQYDPSFVPDISDLDDSPF